MMSGIVINRRTLRENGWLFDMMSSELNRANAEMERKSERVRAAKRAARERGGGGMPIAWGTCPGWLDFVDVQRAGTRIIGGRYVENDRATVVRQIFEWGAQGRGGSWIAHVLNSAGEPVFRKIGPRNEKRNAAGHAGKWHATFVRALLRDRRVLGWLQPCIRVDGKRVPEGDEVKVYPAIVSEELWARVQSAIRARPGVTRSGRESKTFNVVQGLCRCATCGKGVTLRHQRGKIYFVCHLAQHGDCENHRYFPYLTFENFLMSLLTYDLPLLLGVVPAARKSGIEALEGKIEALRSQRRALIAEFGLADRDARDVIADLAVKVAQAERALSEARQDDLINQHEGRESHVAAIREALSRLNSADPDTRDAARLQLRLELRKHISGVWLRPDRTIGVDLIHGTTRANKTGLPSLLTGNRLGGIWQILITDRARLNQKRLRWRRFLCEAYRVARFRGREGSSRKRALMPPRWVRHHRLSVRKYHTLVCSTVQPLPSSPGSIAATSSCNPWPSSTATDYFRNP